MIKPDEKNRHNKIFVFGSKVTGPSHLVKNTPCQDAWNFKIPVDNTAIIAVSDGLGSALHSDTGSKLAVNTAIESISNHFLIRYEDGIFSADITKNNCLIKDAFQDAVSKLKDYSGENNIPIRDLACTLIVIFIDKNEICIGQIGDGGVVGMCDAKSIILSEPAQSEYINEVTPITSANWNEKLKISSHNKDIRALAAFTDGCQRAVLVKKNEIYEPFEPFFKPLLKYSLSAENAEDASEDVKNLLSSGKMTENSDDDKTLVIAAIDNI
ncbi:protein phosphatase 2C domain-containing protein [Methanoplanus sp. FWC-SCC4]|uniref:Protein phosphatase 2C domain-containing protein n=1 Tax=Methanochimaera problematica TaxID=2609417 RepID=A0AA97FCJ4_9EURY|nr:PP2C family serine/threonine-protein phosphatase [Methanoplanus sp. FWC-SCC4]WOF16377.1 protein phosphatase 2C domain-containing protein [Methanoplanus sp. FWC-SCC4]